MTIQNLFVALVAMGYVPSFEGGMGYLKTFDDGDIVMFEVHPDNHGTLTVLIDEIVDHELKSYEWEDFSPSDVLSYVVTNGYYNE